MSEWELSPLGSISHVVTARLSADLDCGVNGAGASVCVFEVRACLCPHPGGGSMFKVEVVLLDVKEGTRSRRQPH